MWPLKTCVLLIIYTNSFEGLHDYEIFIGEIQNFGNYLNYQTKLQMPGEISNVDSIGMNIYISYHKNYIDYLA